MKKIAIVGVEGSGKTVLMAVMGDKYESPDANGVFLRPMNRETYSYYTKETANLRNGKWPLATESSVLELDWMLMRQSGPSASQEQLGQISFLDFGGEIYRRAFGDRAQSELEDEDEQRKNAVERLKAHVKNADALIVLVNLSDIINGKGNDERTIEMNWLSQAILSFAYEKAEKQNVALVFTQADTYVETIASCGGVRGTLSKYLRVIDSNYGSRLALFEVAAVNKTIPASDGSGLPMPAPDFQPEGLEFLLGWIVKGAEPRPRRWRSLVLACALMLGGLVSAFICYNTNSSFKNLIDGKFKAWGWLAQGKEQIAEVQSDILPVKTDEPQSNTKSVIEERETSRSEVQPLKKCSACNGRGEKDCWKCDGVGRVSCTNCNGSGRVETTESEKCWICNGTGEIEQLCPRMDCEINFTLGHVYYGQHVYRCRNCGGMGGNGFVICPVCGGIGCEPCSTCSGYNKVRVDCDNCDNGYITRQTTKKCSDCSGRGTVICPRSECYRGKVSCSSCDGDGWIEE